eukprot:3248014-Rhodomonas_salina.1
MHAALVCTPKPQNVTCSPLLRNKGSSGSTNDAWIMEKHSERRTLMSKTHVTLAPPDETALASAPKVDC